MSLPEWPEVNVVLKEKRFELVLKGINSSKRRPTIDDEELQKSAFAKKSPINLINIDSCGLSVLHSSISNCQNLTSLILRGNELKSVPSEVGFLPKLNFIDLSRNQITSLPESFAKLSTLETLDVSNNKLTDSGLFDFSEMVWLHIVNLSYNELTKIPESLSKEKLEKLHTVNFSHNAIEQVPDDWEELAERVKHINLASNQIKPLPLVLGSFEHVKNLDLSENPFDDRRFRKMTNDKRAKVLSMIEYLRQRVQTKNDPKKSKKKVVAESNDSEKTVIIRSGVPECHVRRFASVSKVRPNLVCVVLRNLNLSGENFKKFINIQTRMHSGVCDNRTIATIGTHELNSLQLPLRYLALPADELFITALSKKTPISARDLIKSLVTDAELARKRQKRNTLNPLHRYLTLVKDLESLPCLIDAKGLVISLAPVTNSDLTKMSENTTSVLVEVSSTVNVEVCKEIMNQLIIESLTICPDLEIDQVRVITENDDLLSAYPDKNDLEEVTAQRTTFVEESNA